MSWSVLLPQFELGCHVVYILDLNEVKIEETLSGHKLHVRFNFKTSQRR